MKFVKFAIVGILLLLGGVFAAGFLLPQTVKVERSIVISRNADTVFQYVNSMQAFQQWSPWAQIDPSAAVTFFGPDSGVGSGMAWSSTDKRVGKGRQTIIESKPSQMVKTLLEFDDDSSGFASWYLTAHNDGVNLAWSFDMDFGRNPIMRYMGLMLDDMLGKFYEQGLGSLKVLVESLPENNSEVVHYQVGEATLTGYIAYPASAQKAPGVLIVHEWWGHNDYARKRADMLAELGYVAFALDMYGDNKVTRHPKEANAFMMEVLGTDGLIKERFMAAYDLLRQNDRVAPEKLAAMGYCFGGGVVLSMARAGVDLAGVVSFHGSLQGLAPVAEGVETPFLVFNGADDPFISSEQLASFTQEMDSAGMQYELINYPGAVHAFTNPEADISGQEYGLPLKYNAAADRDSWDKMQTFFEQVF